MSKGTALAVLPSIHDVRPYLQENRAQIDDALPLGCLLTTDRAIKLVGMAIYKSECAKAKAINSGNRNAKSILDCTKISILSSIVDACSLGLEIGGPLAEAHLVPFGNECVMLVDYKGFLKLARQSNEFEVIEAVDVFEGDDFRAFRDPTPSIHHELCIDDDRGDIRAVYAYATLKGGDKPIFELMTHADVEKIRAKSRSKNSPAWNDHWGEMAKKTVLKRFLKRQPRSLQVARAIEMDNRDYVLDQPQIGQSRASHRGVAGVRSSLGLDAPPPVQAPPGGDVELEQPPESEGDAGRMDELAGDGGWADGRE